MPKRDSQSTISVRISALRESPPCPADGRYMSTRARAFPSRRTARLSTVSPLSLRWEDVDFLRGQITIGADGLAKNHEARTVDFYPKLEAHLREMLAHRQPDSTFLYPSPQRGDKDAHAKTFMETLKIARKASNLPHAGFHDCRHFFISFCVMSGIDFMTIARWVGHKDGGILIGKVYGHLSNEHAKQQAQRICFQPQVLNSALCEHPGTA